MTPKRRLREWIFLVGGNSPVRPYPPALELYVGTGCVAVGPPWLMRVTRWALMVAMWPAWALGWAWTPARAERVRTGAEPKEGPWA